MIFLANENFPRPSTIFLREKGFKIKSIQDDSSSVTDEEVIKIAQEQDLIILTFDKNYGELIFKYAKDNPPSVVFFREKGNTPDFAALKVFNLLVETNISLIGAFTVVEDKSIR